MPVMAARSAAKAGGGPSQSSLHQKLEVVYDFASAPPPSETYSLVPQHSVIRERVAEDRITIGFLSGVAGYIDAVGFITLFGLFPAHMTGELVGLTAALSVGHRMSHTGRFYMIPIFIGAVFLAAVVARLLGRRSRASARVAMLALMTSALVLFALTGYLSAGGAIEIGSWVLLLGEGSAVAAMGFQNAFMRQVLNRTCPTTVMTGNLTHFIFELADAGVALIGLGGRSERTAEAVNKNRFRAVCTALGSFILGAVLGGWLTSVGGALSFLPPLFVALLLTVFACRRHVD